jgi:hypothetical protein
MEDKKPWAQSRVHSQQAVSRQQQAVLFLKFVQA